MMAEEVIVLEEAARDVEQGRDFYEIQMVGLGSYFTDSIISDLESLKISAGVHVLIYGLHRMFSRRFPFAIYYRYDGSRAQVVAILDMRRNPAWTYTQLRKRT